jgi:hypothetical protein
VRSHLAHPTETLVHTLVTIDHKTHYGLRPLCHHHTGPRDQAVILHMMTFLRLWDISICTIEKMEKYESLRR